MPPLVASGVLLTLAFAGSGIQWLGEFTNTRHTNEHSYGYTVQLWREADGVFGLFLAANGLSGDTPIGLLDDVRYHPATGALAFRARLSTGVHYRGPNDHEPTRDRYVFEGALEGDILSGWLSHRDETMPNRPPMREYVRLVKSGQPDDVDAAGYDDWRRRVEPLLARRGPRW